MADDRRRWQTNINDHALLRPQMMGRVILSTVVPSSGRFHLSNLMGYSYDLVRVKVRVSLMVRVSEVLGLRAVLVTGSLRLLLHICSLDTIPYPGRGIRSARAISVGSRELGRETE